MRTKRRRRTDPGQKRCSTADQGITSKRRRTTKYNLFEELPDDLIILILSKLSATASHISELINVFLSCKRFYILGHNRFVLFPASPQLFAIRLSNWCDSTHRFFKLCADSGNAEACFVLGMIRFYCLDNRASGASYMAKAALNSHAPALYSLGVIQFNGSGRAKTEKDLRAGVALCARAANLGYVPAIREVGHCLQDGYGVRRNVAVGRRFLVQADLRELTAAVVASGGTWNSENHRLHIRHDVGMLCSSVTEFLWKLPVPEANPVNRFLVEWFGSRGGSDLKLCSLARCGRPETRVNEFRRCSVCAIVNYCSRACQALDWRLRHKAECLRFREPVAPDPNRDQRPNPNPDRNPV